MRSFVSSRAQFLLCLLIVFASVGAQAQKIKVEYDKSLDFSKFKTFALDLKQDSAKPMLRAAILAAVQDDLPPGHRCYSLCKRLDTSGQKS